MEQRVTLDEAQTHLDELIDAAVSGETVLIIADVDAFPASAIVVE
jgi:antitoxin (DNA-binding transcriptional repressor) of toxin-antitoxin stability system